MGWFCSEIMAQPNPRLVAALRALPGVADSLYLVHSLPGRRPNFPPTGLAFVRDVGDVWGVRPAAPWPDHPAARDMALAIPPDLPRVRTMDHGDAAVGLPGSFLRFLKWLSQDAGSVVAYYAAFSWGGPFEWECGWVFEPREAAYCMVYGESRVRAYREGAAPAEEAGGVLVRVLGHLGVRSPRWEFAPHAADFDWARYKVTRAGGAPGG